MPLPRVRHDETSLPARSSEHQDDSHNDWTYITGSAHGLKLNEDLQNLDGLSIIHGLWARLLLSQSDLVGAERHISTAAEIVSRTGNSQGQCVMAWLKAEHARLAGATESAASFLDEADELCAKHPNTGLEDDIAATRALLQDA